MDVMNLVWAYWTGSAMSCPSGTQTLVTLTMGRVHSWESHRLGEQAFPKLLFFTVFLPMISLTLVAFSAPAKRHLPKSTFATYPSLTMHLLHLLIGPLAPGIHHLWTHTIIFSHKPYPPSDFTFNHVSNHADIKPSSSFWFFPLLSCLPL